MTDRNLFLRAAEGDEEAEREVLARLRRKHPPRYAELAREAIPLAMEECARCYIAGDYTGAMAALIDSRTIHGLVGETADVRGMVDLYEACETLIRAEKWSGRLEWHRWMPDDPQWFEEDGITPISRWDQRWVREITAAEFAEQYELSSIAEPNVVAEFVDDENGTRLVTRASERANLSVGGRVAHGYPLR